MAELATAQVMELREAVIQLCVYSNQNAGVPLSQTDA